MRDSQEAPKRAPKLLVNVSFSERQDPVFFPLASERDEMCRRKEGRRRKGQPGGKPGSSKLNESSSCSCSTWPKMK